MIYFLSKYQGQFRKHLHFDSTDVMTPAPLAREMVEELFDHLPDNPYKLKRMKFLDPACGTGTYLAAVFDHLFYLLVGAIPDNEERARHILENQLYGVDVNQVKLKLAKRFLDHKDRFDLNLICDDSLERDWNMEFDVVVGNPPYQKNDDAASSNPIWHKFVKKSFGIVKKSGCVVLVHPSGWRSPGGQFDDVKHLVLNNNLIYLSVNDFSDGKNVFNVNISFDWYVVENKPVDKNHTTVEFKDRTHTNINTKKLKFIPTKNFEKFDNLIAREGEETVEFLYDYSYHHRADFVNTERDNNFKYPCVYTITESNGVKFLYSSTKNRGHFGKSKVIWSNGLGTYPILDLNGEYGLSEYAFAIVDKKEVLPAIKKAMQSERFINLMESVKFTNNKYSRKVISLFRKDFWKEFVDEE